VGKTDRNSASSVQPDSRWWPCTIAVRRSGPNACSYRSRPIARRGIGSSLSVFVIRWSRHGGCRDGRLCGSVPTPTEYVRANAVQVQGAPKGSRCPPPGRSVSPGPGWVTLRLPEPNQSEGDGLASELTHPLSLSDANTARVTVRSGYPKPVQPVGRRGSYEGRIPPSTGYSGSLG